MTGWLLAATIGMTTQVSSGALPFPDRVALVKEFITRDGAVEPLPFDRFRLKMSDLIGIAIPGPSPTEWRQKVLAQRDQLQARRRRLTVDELLLLGEADYRLNDFEGAYSAWLEASVHDRRGYLPLSHLALLKLVTGDWTEARRYRLAAKDNRPRDVAGLSPKQAEWFFRVEAMIDPLIRQRWKERQDGIPADRLMPDDLFGVTFAGDDGTYLPGTIAESERAKLPADALATVQLLLLWMPHDSRLYWLLGELYNASGQPNFALTILNECVDPRRFQPELLRAHRQTLKEHFERLEAAEKEKAQQMDESKRRSFFVAVAIGGTLVGLLLLWQIRLIARRWRRPARM